MSESGASSSNSEIDDPGRDPKGLDPPRNPLATGTGGLDQDTGQGPPEGSPGIEGQSMMPEAPTDDDDRA